MDCQSRSLEKKGVRWHPHAGMVLGGAKKPENPEETQIRSGWNQDKVILCANMPPKSTIAGIKYRGFKSAFDGYVSITNVSVY